METPGAKGEVMDDVGYVETGSSGSTGCMETVLVL